MDYEKKHQGRFMEGFFWGAVIGGAATYVLSHKKGRELVKELFQDGIDFLEERAQKSAEHDVFLEQDMMEDQLEETPVEMASENYQVTEVEEAVAPKPYVSKKRFFKKNPKKRE